MIRGALHWGCFFVLSVFIFAFGTKAFAQTAGSDTVPVVTIQATDPIAITYQPSNSDPSPFEPLGKLGVFTVFRQGNTNLTLNVYYQIGGTASNGVDYALISNWVNIPAGATSNSIPILPLANRPSPSVTKTVVLQLAPSPTLNPVNFEIGVPSNAVVYIETTNPPLLPDPEFGIGIPNDGTVFYTPTNIFIDTGFSYLGGYPSPTNVEFFANASDLGKGIFGLYSGFGGGANFTWTNPPPGDYALTAVASYNGFASVTSAPVNIAVKVGPPPIPPPVNIIEPKDGDLFYTPTNIQIVAKASDPDGSVSNVEFFAGTNDLGQGNMVVLDPPGIGGVTGPVYLFNWLNAPPGNYPLTAAATDNASTSTTSAPVNITVKQALSPTNFPPWVRIISPANGAIFRAPINIPIYATIPGGFVTGVEFFAGTNSLGIGQPVPTPVTAKPSIPNPGSKPPLPILFSTNVYSLTWSNAPVGSYVLTAKATLMGSNDFIVMMSISDPVNITILPSLPPPTNHPTIVNIVATDPVAVEGTNCWIWKGETNSTPTWAAWPTAICRSFTNSGPKDAVFTMRRFGDISDNLTVNYDVGGTASNGVDYVALPGYATIPAGERDALITIVPIDDGPPDVNKTVILALTPSTNNPPDYLPGFPRRASAIIIDSNVPHPVTGILPDKSFHFVAPGPDAAWFCIEYSTNLVNWTPVCTNQVVNGSIDFVDPDAANSLGRFYRILPVLDAP